MFEFDGNAYTLADMLESNAHDADFCGWAKSANIGDYFCGCTRIS